MAKAKKFASVLFCVWQTFCLLTSTEIELAALAPGATTHIPWAPSTIGLSGIKFLPERALGPIWFVPHPTHPDPWICFTAGACQSLKKSSMEVVSCLL